MEDTKPKHPGGRPLKFGTPEELKEKIDDYFRSCWRQKIDQFGNPVFLKDANGKKTDEKVMVQFRPYTITGLALALDTTRETLLEYEGEVEGRERSIEFADAVKRAKLACHQYAEEQLYIGRNPTGPIFNLKNNYGWKDKNETDFTSGGQVINGFNYVKPPVPENGDNNPDNSADI